MLYPIDWGFSLPFYASAFLLGYLFGSLPTGFLLTKYFGRKDIRDIGSGNIGATNVLRSGSLWLALATLIIDMAKAYIAITLANLYGEAMAICAGLGAMMGHVFPIWLKWRGGKAVSTYLGSLAALYWPLALAFIATWLLVAMISRFASLASLIAVALIPFLAIYFENYLLRDFALFAVILIIWTHRDNLKRLYLGVENRIGGSGKNKADG